MFIGHFGLAFGAKKAAPAASLGTLFAASQFADLLWPTLVLLGYERVEVRPGVTKMTPLDFVSYPYSHSLLALCGWGLAFGAIYWAMRRTRISAAVTVALLIVSHWVLDYITHRPDLPLTLTGADRFGLGLWNSVPATLAVESTIFGAGLLLYLRETTPRDRIGSIGLWTLVGFPALTIPTGLSDGGLPYGMQLAGSAGGDDRLLRVASWCEAVIGFKGSPG